MKYSIITDSSFNLSDEDINRYNVQVIDLHVYVNNMKLGDNLNEEEFFNELVKDNSIVKTAAPSLGEISNAFKEALKISDNVIYLSISSKFSSNYQNACIVAKDFDNVEVFDTKGVFSKNKVLFDYLIKNLDTDLSIKQVLTNLEKLRDNTYIYFIVKSLKHLQKNGRIGKASALIGELISIKPVLTVDLEGSVSSFSKARSNKKAIDKIIDQIKLCGDVSNLYITQININDDIEYFMSKYDGEILTSQKMPPVIAVHAGPESFTVSFTDKNKIDFEV